MVGVHAALRDASSRAKTVRAATEPRGRRDRLRLSECIWELIRVAWCLNIDPVFLDLHYLSVTGTKELNDGDAATALKGLGVPDGI